MTAKEPHELAPEEIEEIEKLTLRWIFQAVSDFGMEAHVIFLKSPDNASAGSATVCRISRKI